MGMTTSPVSHGAGPELRAQYRAAMQRRAYFASLRPPPAQAPRPRPVSPFVAEVRRRRMEAEIEARVAVEHLVAEVAQSPAPVPRWRQILDEVAEKHGIGVADITGGSRRYAIQPAKQEAAYRMRHEITVRGQPMSYPEIAKRMGMGDHTSALHAVRKHASRIDGGQA
jgi:hypothetical protein